MRKYFGLRISLLFTCPKCGLEQSMGLHRAEGVKCTGAHCIRCHEGIVLVLRPAQCIGCNPDSKFTCNDLSRVVIVEKVYDHEVKKEVI